MPLFFAKPASLKKKEVRPSEKNKRQGKATLTKLPQKINPRPPNQQIDTNDLPQKHVTISTKSDNNNNDSDAESNQNQEYTCKLKKNKNRLRKLE